MSEAIETPEVVETPIVEQAVNTENAEPNVEVVETKPEKTFTQAELDSILTKRLERERETITKKTAQEARDAVVAELGYTWNGTPITTEAQLKQAQKDQKAYEELSKKDLPDEVIQEMIESRNFREETKSKEQKAQEKTKKAADAQAFLEAYPDVKAEDIPASVWLEVDRGKSLVDAYARHENQTLKQQLAEATKAKEIEALNAQNAASSTGSVTGQGSAPVTAFFSQKQVNEMSQAEVNRNWKAVNESMKNPKFYD